MDIKYSQTIAVSGLMLVLGAAPAPGEDWAYGVELYALAADVKATSAEGEGIRTEFDDILIADTGTTSIDVVGAARYLSMDTDIKLTLDPIGSIPEKESASNWDGVVGVRGKTELSENWYLTYYADVGAGESDLTWQAMAGINYRFENLDVVLGYQHLEWEFDDQLL